MPLLGSVAAKTGDALVAELLLACGLDKVRRKLERHPAAVQSILLDAEVKSRIDPAVCEWMKDLKTAAYQADDVLDDVRYEALLRRAPSSVAAPPHARKMKDTLEMIDELVVEMNNFYFLQHAEAPSIVHPQTHCRWMAELKTAAYQTDDILDDFHYEALRRRAAHRSAAHKVLSYFIANSPVVFRLSMSRKMKDDLEMIDELVVEMNNLFPSLALFSSLVAGIIRTIP